MDDVMAPDERRKPRRQSTLSNGDPLAVFRRTGLFGTC